MAAIVNERTLRLQATVPRIIPVLSPELEETMDAVRGVTLTASAPIFKYDAASAVSPASITFTAKKALLSSAITISVVSGTATLTGNTGTSATLLAGNMSTDSVTIRARVTEDSVNYDSTVVINKVRDGASGAAGPRVPVFINATVSNLVRFEARTSGRARWAAGTANETNAGAVDLAARDAVWQALGNSGSAPSNSHLYVGDTVTITNSAQSVVATGYWNGALWMNPGMRIDTNLLVDGDVSGRTITGGTFTGSTFQTSISGDSLIRISPLGSPSSSAPAFTVGTLGDGLQIYKQPSEPIVFRISGAGTMSIPLANISNTGNGNAFRIQQTGGGTAFQITSTTVGMGVTASGSSVAVTVSNTGSGGGINVTTVSNRAVEAASGSATAVYATSTSGTGVEARSTSGVAPALIANKTAGNGPALQVSPSSTGAHARFDPGSSLPSSGLTGDFYVHLTHGPCLRIGSAWYPFQLSGTPVT
ncbi:hypothetical protein [Xenophilus sp. Marseille-Q4582]|uniref:hypothetical protein n=1 Tax=Xenophilus sp. Marseille-Q4582 TaxID=2866600 RepID=UPI001CE434F8|nr:hypothetical protein [Xenophilus sp. Marseille-Q4582]